jgi:hypothetical protein
MAFSQMKQAFSGFNIWVKQALRFTWIFIYFNHEYNYWYSLLRLTSIALQQLVLNFLTTVHFESKQNHHLTEQ